MTLRFYLGNRCYCAACAVPTIGPSLAPHRVETTNVRCAACGATGGAIERPINPFPSDAVRRLNARDTRRARRDRRSRTAYFDAVRRYDADPAALFPSDAVRIIDYMCARSRTMSDAHRAALRARYLAPICTPEPTPEPVYPHSLLGPTFILCR